jgi:phosphohistidine swiveling domain-containing protein
MTNDVAIGASSATLISLDDPACEAHALAGNKAATLAVLRRAGFDVPPGVVLSADSVGNGDDDLPAPVQAALQDVPHLLGPGPWAVRSSSTVEDSDEASFAGQFETVLNVDMSGLADAVLHCWRSRLTDRVKAYGGERGSGSMAVLIQPMIDADAAGVAFTIDPVSGRKRTVIEAVEGLGERLVSGAATPERWTVNEDGSMETPSLATALDADKAGAIADLARRVEEHFGPPQDIEWAIARGSVWLLQARPITTLPNGPELIPIPIEVPPGVWTTDLVHWPIPASPFGRAMSEELRKSIPAAFAEFGILIDRAEHVLIGGWLYAQVIPVGAPPAGRSGGRGRQRTPPRWLLALIMRLHPAIRRRTRAARKAIESDLPFALIRRWYQESRPAYQEDAERTLALDLGSMSDAELAAQLDHRIGMLGRPEHASVGFAYFIVMYELAEACRELLGWDTARMLSLLEGLSTVTTEPARRLAELADLARSKPAVQRLLATADESTPARLTSVDAEFAVAFSRYVDATGHRAIRYDAIEPTLAEVPHRLLRLVADQLELAYSPDEVAQEALRRRTLAEEEAHALLASRPADWERFDRALARAREAYPTFDDRVWHTTFVQLGLLRYLGLEIGRRLVNRGQLAHVDDVFFLDVQEARSALFDGVDRHEVTRVRQGRRAWAIAHPGPMSYGEQPSGEPPFDLLPPEARLVNKAVAWGVAEFWGGHPIAHATNVLAGTPASAGRFTGTARVVLGEHQFDKIQVGDVVVCPVTSATWSVVFPSIGALVTDAGGILSHPAIIAREHGIPAVVGTGNATDVLKDGQRVTVDGNTGIVELVEGVNLLDGPWATSNQTEPVSVPPS